MNRFIKFDEFLKQTNGVELENGKVYNIHFINWEEYIDIYQLDYYYQSLMYFLLTYRDKNHPQGFKVLSLDNIGNTITNILSYISGIKNEHLMMPIFKDIVLEKIKNFKDIDLILNNFTSVSCIEHLYSSKNYADMLFIFDNDIAKKIAKLGIDKPIIIFNEFDFNEYDNIKNILIDCNELLSNRDSSDFNSIFDFSQKRKKTLEDLKKDTMKTMPKN